MDSNGISNHTKELEVEGNFSKEENNISQNIKKSLKNKEENEKLTKSDEENNLINEYEDSLSYSTFYRSPQNSFNKNSKDIELSIKRGLSSNISNSHSDINNHELNGIPSDKQYFSQKSIKRINLFKNESYNLITDYYKGTDDYFKSIFLNKNDYQKSKNYIKKEIFFQDYDDYNNDISEDNKNNIINEGNMNSNNSFISLNNNMINNSEEKSFNEINKNNNNIIINNPNTNTNNINNINNINNTNNNINNINKNNEEKKNNIYNFNSNNNFYINQFYFNPNINFNNINGSKYDVSMYCLGFYSVDCKSLIKINSYYFLLLFSIFRNTNCSIYPKKIKR